MNIEQVRRQVNRIRTLAFDDEEAHSREDSLWAKVLEAIARGATNPSGLASVALETQEIEFKRWCA